MRRPGGYAVWTDPDAPTVERDTFTCAHCNAVTIVKPKAPPEDAGGFCRQCMAMTCKRCTAQGTCTPFLKRVEISERRSRLLRAMGV